jgi:hypothetical protein
MGKVFDVVLEEKEGEDQTHLVVKVLYKGVPIYVDTTVKKDEILEFINEWKNFVEIADGAISSVVVDKDGNTYTALVFLRVLKDTERFRVYEYLLDVFNKGVCVFDKSAGMFYIINEQLENLEDQDIEKAMDSATPVFVLHVYK